MTKLEIRNSKLLSILSLPPPFILHLRYLLDPRPRYLGRRVTCFLGVNFIVTTMGLKPSPSGESFRFCS
jgi:hypothetical protein